MNHDPVTLPRPADAAEARCLPAGPVFAESGRHGIAALEESIVKNDIFQALDRMEKAVGTFQTAFRAWQEADGWANPEWDDVVAALEKLGQVVKACTRPTSLG